jgi:hypothetical protein
LLVGFLLLAGVARAGDALSPGWARAAAARHELVLPVPVAFTDSDLVVGWPDTAETRRITGRYEHSGRIIVVNRGTLVLDSADFVLRGDVFVQDRGTLRVRKGSLLVAQQFAYQYGGTIAGRGRVELDTCRVNYGGFSWGPGLTDSASFEVDCCTLRLGFTTLGMLGSAQVRCSGSDFASEYVVFDSSRLDISRCDTALVWLGLPTGCVVDTRLPGADSTIRHWEFRSGLPGVQGVGYSVTLDTVTGVMWGAFPLRGSSAIIRDSRLRATGVILQGTDSVYLAGLVNNQQYPDFTLGLADRTFRLVNTHLATWNLYPSDTVRFVLESSVFGELLAGSSAHATVQNAICDGTGGYIGSEWTSQLLVVGSMVNTQVVSRDRSVLFGAASTIRYGSVNATDASAMVLVFCTSEYEPQARDTSVLYLCDYTVPPNASVESEFAITGTADLRPGPYNPLRFGSYRMSFASADSPAVWHPIGTTHTEPVLDDTLETWDTHGLAPGVYVLKMTLKNSVGDSLEPTKGVILVMAGLAGARTSAPAGRLVLDEPVPNPARGASVISYVAPPQSRVDLAVLDLQGRVVARLVDRDGAPGSGSVTWRANCPGVYIVRLKADGRVRTRKLVVSP